MTEYDQSGSIKLAYAELYQGNYEAAENSFKQVIKTGESGEAWRGLGYAVLGSLSQMRIMDADFKNRQLSFIFKTWRDSTELEDENKRAETEETIMNYVLQQVQHVYSIMKKVHDEYIDFENNRLTNSLRMFSLYKSGNLESSISLGQNLQDSTKNYQGRIGYIKQYIDDLIFGVDKFVNEENPYKAQFFAKAERLRQEAEWYMIPEEEKKRIRDEQTPKLPSSQRDEKIENNAKWIFAIIILLVIVYCVYRYIN